MFGLCSLSFERILEGQVLIFGWAEFAGALLLLVHLAPILRIRTS